MCKIPDHETSEPASYAHEITCSRRKKSGEMARGSSSSASAKAAAKAAQPVRNNDENSRRDEDHEDLLRESAVAEMPQMYRRSLLAMGDPTRARRRMVQRAAQVEPEQNGDPLAPTRSVTIQIGEEPVLVGGNPDLPATAQLVWSSFTEIGRAHV